MTDDEDNLKLSNKGRKKSGKIPSKDKRKAKKGDTSDHDSADDFANDDGPLVSTRLPNPHIRGGRRYDTSREPFTLDFNVSGYQRDRRRLAIRNRIAPHPVTLEQLENHLGATGWDVDRAYQRWYTEHQEALPAIGRGELIRPSFSIRPRADDKESEKDVGQASPNSADFIPYPHDAIPERERRRLVSFLQELVEETRALEGTVRLKRSEAVMLLQEAGWDVVQARDLYLEHQLAFEEFVNSYNHFRGPSQLRSEQDDRLSRLIHMTGRRDIGSLDAHLRHHNYNFIAAVVAWQKSGIPAINNAEWPEIEGQLPVQDDVVWSSENPSDMEEQKEGDGAEQEKDVVKYVTTINTDRLGANKGAPDHTKMIIEHIRNGKYVAHIFKHRKYDWSVKSSDGLPKFDWNKQKDVNMLNNWRREIFARVDGIVTRPRSIPWLEAEDDFIYDLHRELWDELMAEQPEAHPKSLLPLPVPASRLREWAKKFNDEFEGTIRKGSDEARPNRSSGAINTRRHRVQRIIDDFRLERNNPRPKDEQDETVGKGRTTRRPSTSNKPAPMPPKSRKRSRKEVESDSDEDENSGVESKSEDENRAGNVGRGKKARGRISKGKPAPRKPNAVKGNEEQDE